MTSTQPSPDLEEGLHGDEHKPGFRLHLGALSVCLLLSGAAGLAWELLQVRLIAPFLGAGDVAHVVVLVAFFGGLSLGSAIVGRLADRFARRALMLYALLELFCGLLAIASPTLVGAVCAAFETLTQATDPASRLLVPRLLVAMATLMPSAIAMGGTLPLLARHAADVVSDIPAAPDVHAILARLYATNTAGAVIGALAVAFWLVPDLGVRSGLAVAGTLNLAAASLAALIHVADRRTVPEELPDQTAITREASGKLPPSLLAAAFAGGFGALVLEVTWTRVFALVFGSSAQAFALMLVAFLLGIAGGGFASAALVRRLGAAGPRIAYATAGLVVLLQLPLYERLPWLQFVLAQALERRADNYPFLLLFQGTVAVLWMLPVTLASGAALPALVGHARRVGLGRATGAVFAANTAGTVIAPLLTAFVFFGFLGLQRTLVLGSAAFAMAALLAGPRPSRAALTVAAVAIGLGMAWPRWDGSVMHAGGFRRWTVDVDATFAEFRQQRAALEVVLEVDGPEDSVVVLRNDAGETYLKVNAKTDASDTPDLATQRLVAHIPLALHRAAIGAGGHSDPAAARSVFVVGTGSGVTAAAAAQHANTRVTTVELSRGVLQALPWFAHVNHDLVALPNVRIAHGDARDWLTRDDASYDVIINQPSNPWVAGNAALFSSEFFAAASERLAPGGVMAQWMHVYAMDDTSVELVFSTFAQAFAQVTVWWVNESDIILVGSQEPLRPDLQALSDVLGEPAVHADLTEGLPEHLRVGNVRRLLALQILGERGFAAAFGDHANAVHSDLHPRLEFAAPVALFVGRNAERIAGLDERLKPPGSTDLLVGSVRWSTDDLIDLIEFFGGSTAPAADALTGSLVHATHPLGDLGSMPTLATRATGLPVFIEQWTQALIEAPALHRDDCTSWLAAVTDALPVRASAWYAPPVDAVGRGIDRCVEAVPDQRVPWRAIEADLLVRTGHPDAARRQIDLLLSEPLPDQARDLLRQIRP